MGDRRLNGSGSGGWGGARRITAAAWRDGLLAACVAAAAVSAAAQQPAEPAASPTAPPAAAGGAAAFVAPVDGTRLGSGWRTVGWPEQKPPATRYRAEGAVAGAPAADVLRIEAAGSYGNLVLAMQPQAAPRRLAWSWRVTQGNPKVDLAQKAGDDTPAKVCLAFDLPLARVPFVERQVLRLARSRSADPLPAATLCWVWGGDEAVGTRVDNPYSRRVRQIVLRRAADADGRWFDEQVDVAADFRRTFGDESETLPPVVAVIVAGDADNTGAHSVAQVARLRWLP